MPLGHHTQLTKRLLKIFITLVVVFGTNLYTVYAAEWTKPATPSNFISWVENSPWGILIAEYDTRTTLNPYNGIYISNNLGASWLQTGLNKRGVTGIKYFNQKIWASSYYVVNSKVGLFVSNDKGLTWNNIGPNFSASTVFANDDAVLVGGYSNGLWASYDEGTTWVQKIGTGWYGPKIDLIKCEPNICLVSAEADTYYSKDGCVTFNKDPYLTGRGAKAYAVNNSTILAGTSAGIYRSQDFGLTWIKIAQLQTNDIQSLMYFNGLFYASVNDSSLNTTSVYFSSDNGSTWQNTNLNIDSYKKIKNMSWVFADPKLIFASTSNDGVYKYEIPQQYAEILSFLDVPWNQANENDFINKISAFFDHIYPLLGYRPEPVEEQDTTTNFYGYKDYQPNIYYSSHSGTDYALPIGTEIKAPADGMATYYYCGDCGNTIKINHQNGYQTVYMHFQKEGLITTTGPVQVLKGQILGRVGMTGRSTGPHLHFEVHKDTNGNGNFNDDLPDSRVDPYGWQNTETSDPWPLFTGTKSLYLWNNLNALNSKFLPNTGDSSEVSNIKVTTDPQTTDVNLTLFIKIFGKPILREIQKNLGYVENTSVIIEAIDQTSKGVNTLLGTAEIIFDISNSSLQNLNPESLKVYSYDETLNLWVPLSTIVDLVSHKITAQTSHFSRFAVLGDLIDSVEALTSIDILGVQENDWYISYPLITLTPSEQDSTVYYTYDGEGNWNLYLEPFEIHKDGMVDIMFRSVDSAGNLEETNNYVLKIDTKGLFKKSVKVAGSSFSVSF